MDRLAVGEAMSAGFRLVSREPLVFAGWILVEFVVSLLPSLVLELIGAAGNPAVATAALPLVILYMLFLSAWLGAAVMRAVLEPGERRGLYLRAGGQEAQLALSFVVLGVILFLAALPAVFVFSLIAALAFGAQAMGAAGGAQTNLAVADPTTIAGVTGIVYGGVLLVSLWLMTRLGLVMPIAYGERRVRLGEAWRASRPHAGRLFLVLAVLTALLVAAYVAIVGSVLSMVSATIPLPELNAALQRDPQALAKALNPTTVTALGLMLLLVSAIARVAFFGAWADIYRQVRAARPAETFD